MKPFHLIDGSVKCCRIGDTFFFSGEPATCSGKHIHYLLNSNIKPRQSMLNSFSTPVRVLWTFAGSTMVHRPPVPNHVVPLFIAKCEVSPNRNTSFSLLEKQPSSRQLKGKQLSLPFQAIGKCNTKVQNMQKICISLNLLLILNHILFLMKMGHHQHQCFHFEK